MSAVRLCKIKLQNSGVSPGDMIFGKPSIHFSTGVIFLPLPKIENIARIDTENDRLLEPLVNTGWISRVNVCQDRDLIFTLSGDVKQIKTFKAAGEEVKFSLDISSYPEDIAFDSDRDLLFVLGTRDPPPSYDKTIDLYRFPESKHLGGVSTNGRPVSVIYDELEDRLLVLSLQPAEISIFKPSEELSLESVNPLPDPNPVTFGICPSRRKMVIGTSSGKIIISSAGESPAAIVASFREPVSMMAYNPLLDHLYVAFTRSRNLAVLDLESMKVRENIRCSSEVSDILFDQMHNKFYVFMEASQSIEVYLDQGR